MKDHKVSLVQGIIGMSSPPPLGAGVAVSAAAEKAVPDQAETATDTGASSASISASHGTASIPKDIVAASANGSVERKNGRHVCYST